MFADGDVQAVARQLAAAALVSAGQHGGAPRRILVHASRFEQTKTALRRALGEVILGAGDEAGSGMGPLIDAAALVAAGVRTEQALARCAEVVLHGCRSSGDLADGYFLSPTLVVERDGASAPSTEEIYGPFISIGQFDNDDEALACANAMRMAHSVSVWTGDAARSQRLLRALGSASIMVNRHDWLAQRQIGRAHPHIDDGGGFSDFLALPRP